MEIDMRAPPDFRLQLMHNNKWLVVTFAWDLDALTPQIDFYKKQGRVYRVQKLTNGKYK